MLIWVLDTLLSFLNRGNSESHLYSYCFYNFFISLPLDTGRTAQKMKFSLGNVSKSEGNYESGHIY